MAKRGAFVLPKSHHSQKRNIKKALFTVRTAEGRLRKHPGVKTASFFFCCDAKVSQRFTQPPSEKTQTLTTTLNRPLPAQSHSKPPCKVHTNSHDHTCTRTQPPSPTASCKSAAPVHTDRTVDAWQAMIGWRSLLPGYLTSPSPCLTPP